MTEGEENIIIKGVLLEAISRDFSEELSNNKEVSVSPRFKRQMMAMMNNPNKWAERHKRDYRRRFVKVVATIVLTCSLPFGVLTVASPTVRAAVIDWVVEWYESSIIYKFFGESDSTKLPLYEVIDLPFDYTRIGIPQELPNNTEIIYENSDGEILRFEYMRVEEGSAIIIDAENMEVTEIGVNGCPGHLYISVDPEQSNCIWQSLNDMYLGYGLVQWDDGKLFIDWAKKEGVISAATAEAVNSLAYSNPKKLMDAELDYLIVSMNTVGNWFKPDNNQSKYGTSETLTASQFKVSNKSADILARIFCGHYERPGVPKISERVANAKKWYNFL